MMKIFLTSVFVLMLVSVCYGQLYEPEQLWHLCGEEPGDWFGKYIAGIGDVNNDGYGDFLSSNKATGTAYEGHFLLFYGGDPPDTIPDMTFHNPLPYGSFGGKVENIGDVNGDEWDDFTARGWYSQDDISIVYVYFGGNSMDTIPDLELSEVRFEDVFGSRVKGIGDVNGDGYDDIAVRASNYSSSRGKVWIYFGGSPMDSVADWEKVGSRSQAWFGYSIAGKGDLNGDGYDDFSIYERIPYTDSLYHHIFFGSDQLDTIPDVIIESVNYFPGILITDGCAMISNLNGDVYSDLVITAAATFNMVVFYGGDPMDTEIDLVLEGFDWLPSNYEMKVSIAGDVNRDGFDDIIGAQLFGDTHGGVTLVFLGSPWMDGQPDMEWRCWGTPWEGCGRSLADGGDINGDGVDDIMFGAYHGDTNSRGCVEIWTGDTAFVVNVPERNPETVPMNFRLFSPYPNPFNSSLTIPFDIIPGLGGGVRLKIYNVLGQEIVDLTGKVQETLSNQNSGPYQVTWNSEELSGADLSSGILFVVLQTGSKLDLKKVVLLR